MANVIKHKRGSGSDPVANDLVVGEVAIRTDVGKLFTKMDNGSVAEIAGGGSDIAINTLSSSSGTGGGSATFNGSAFRFTLSAPPSVSAQQLLVSINGVIQKPVAGTGQPSEGFSVDGSDIILGAAPATGSDFFILTFKSLGVSEPADNSVTSAKIADGAIVNADINASAAIAGSKISPDFGSQNIVTTGNLELGALPNTVTNSLLKIAIQDTDGTFKSDDTVKINPAQNVLNVNGLNIGSTQIRTNNTEELVLTTGSGNGTTDIKVNPTQITLKGNVDVTSGIDVTGAITGTGDLTIDTNTLHVDSSNNRVGIGTTSPSQELTVAGSDPIISVQEASVSSQVDIGTGTTTGFINIQKADGTRTIQFSGNGVSYLNSGNVGIGTTNPVKQLVVMGTGDPTIRIQELASGSGKRLELGVTDSGAVGFIAANQSASKLAFQTVGSERMRIDSSGNVGIGTTSPSSLFELRQSSASHQIVSINRANSNTAALFLGNDSSNNALISSNNSNLLFGKDDSNTFTEYMRLDSSGNLFLNGGAGNLFINGGSYNGGGASPGLYVRNTSGRQVKIHNRLVGTSSLQLTNATTGEGEDAGFQVAQSGNTAILANAEAEVILLQNQQSVQGSTVIKVSKPQASSSVASHMIHFLVGGHERGAIAAGSSFGSSPSFTSISDYRVKTNIRNYTDGWNNIKALPVKLFDINKEGEEAQNIKGWIAHEVQTVIPEAVTGIKDAKKEDGSDEYQTLGYGMFMPDVVNALQTAIAKIETLETKVAALEAK